MIMRKVIQTSWYERVGFAPGGFTIISQLECGHDVATKGSAGYAKYRKCHECELLERGAVRSVTNTSTGCTTVETWDPVTKFPRRTHYRNSKKEVYHGRN